MARMIEKLSRKKKRRKELKERKIKLYGEKEKLLQEMRELEKKRLELEKREAIDGFREGIKKRGLGVFIRKDPEVEKAAKRVEKTIERLINRGVSLKSKEFRDVLKNFLDLVERKKRELKWQ